MSLRLDHLTAFVADADAAAGVMARILGAEPVAAVALPGMAIRTFRLGDAEIHLNQPTGPGPVDEHLRRHGPAYHHLALRVDDLDASCADLVARGFAVLGAPVTSAPGLREIFLDPRTTAGLWIQLVERRPIAEGTADLDHGAVFDLVDQLRR
jgi:methylmalonyl-CoA/ethylmalonyl-CoA epimerase